jgi:hypothetical protein
VWIAAALAVGGCAADGPSGSKLSLADFSNPEKASTQRPSKQAVQEILLDAGLGMVPETKVMPNPESVNNTFFNVEAVVGQPVVVDSLIGQVNGRPIYADEVLTPIMDRLSATYRDQPYSTFQRQLTGLVIEQLRAVIINELIVAESRAGMSSEQQGGLLAFMNQVREEAVRKRGGVEHEAERRLIEEEGKTIDEYLEDEQEKMLIQEVLKNKVAPQTVVSWRDIERSYRARKTEFQPASTVTLGRIRLSTAGNEEQVSLLQAEIEAGEPFMVVARQAGMSNDGVWQTFKLPDGGLGELPLASFYTPHIKDLKPGEVSKPFERGVWTIWVSVIDIQKPLQRSLDDSDVQRMLQQQISMARAQEAEGRFIGEVLQRGIFDDIKLMGERAVAIAFSRFPPK